eukprot:TRINITY_DN5760_c0_g2_i1.p1 TRINITY_DN5760_c0_g2~~TRINITY_DN5760_c0_g2_i1.p1  ORF type:complete len:181 (-),score=14.94 TRINITY_DN5760_c0_g2_i1:27-569(-)
MEPYRLDLALLEVSTPQWLKLATIPMVSQNNVTELQHLAGLCLREHNRVSVHGRVMELEKDGYGVQTDMGGTHGFSGCGYFANHELTCVHQGEGEFTHSNLLEGRTNDGFSAQSALRTDFKNKVRDLFVNASDQAQRAYIKSLERTISFIARNPRTRCVPARWAYDLRSGSPVSLPKCEA